VDSNSDAPCCARSRPTRSDFPSARAAPGERLSHQLSNYFSSLTTSTRGILPYGEMPCIFWKLLKKRCRAERDSGRSICRAQSARLASNWSSVQARPSHWPSPRSDRNMTAAICSCASSLGTFRGAAQPRRTNIHAQISENRVRAGTSADRLRRISVCGYVALEALPNTTAMMAG
jgi:hypothetical protein